MVRGSGAPVAMGAQVLPMIEVVCFKYRPRRPYRSTYGPQAVNTLRNMVRRNLHLPHRFSCITDDAEGLDDDIRVIPIWEDYADVPNPSLMMGPSCYRRLKLFSEEARALIGERILCLDLDMVITADITTLIDVPDDLVMADGISLEKDSQKRSPYCRYNGSMMLLTAGMNTHVWTEFDPLTSPQIAHRAGQKGSDQGWISHCMGPGVRTWKREHGIYSFRNHIMPRPWACPRDARVVLFHGRIDPWSAQAQTLGWVRTRYH